MRITNQFDLPQALVNVVDTGYKYKDRQFSYSSLGGGIREIMLKRRYNDEIVQDVSDMMNLIFGTAVHALLEKNGKTGREEMPFKITIPIGLNEFYLTGYIDLWDEKDESVVDYKTATVQKYLSKDYDEYYKQGMTYAWALKYLIEHNQLQGVVPKKIKFHMFLKDWKRKEYESAKLRGEDYPPHMFYTYYHEITKEDYDKIEEYLFGRFDLVAHYYYMPIEDIPECSDEEKWKTKDSWKLWKKGNKIATKNYFTKEEAEFALAEKQSKAKKGEEFYLEYTKGIANKCKYWCIVSELCKKYSKDKPNISIEDLDLIVDNKRKELGVN